MQPRKLTLLAPRADACPECAVDHPADMPHNRASLYYQMKFHQEHNRWPTWEDAMAHCDADMKEQWRRELIKEGIWEG